MRRAVVFALMTLAGGCGRVGYDEGDAGRTDDAAIEDAAIDARTIDARAIDATIDPSLDANLDAPPIDAFVLDDAFAFDAWSPDDAAIDASGPDAPEACGSTTVRFDEVGSGVTDDPFVICNDMQWSDLVARAGDTSASFRLESDLDVTESLRSFAGVFSGEGHTVRTLGLTNGLFGVTNGAQIFDLRVEGGLSDSFSLTRVGVVASEGTGTRLTNVSVRTVGNVVWGDADVGGIVGHCTDCVFRQCAVRVDRLIANQRVGLVAGTMVRGEIHEATLESLQLEARGTSGCVYAGGVVGHATGVTIGEVAVSGSLLPSEGGYGGAFGLLGNRSMVSDLRITMSVPDVMSVVCDGHGGVVGQLRGDAQVTRVLVVGDVAGGGGLVGDVMRGGLFSSAVVGPHPGFPEVYVRTCSDFGSADLHHLDDGTPDVMGACPVPGTAHAAIDYFYTPTNAPMTSWDFTAVWDASPISLPTLRRVPPLP